MRPSFLEPYSHRMLAWAPAAGQSLRALHEAVRWGASHTGLPAVLVAAMAIVVGYHLFRRSLRFAVEVVVTVALLLVATQCGWITW
jgi:hypothetical protein